MTTLRTGMGHIVVGVVNSARGRRQEREAIIDDWLIAAGFWLLFGREHERDAATGNVNGAAALPELDIAGVSDFLTGAGYSPTAVATLIEGIAAGRSVAVHEPTATLSVARYEKLRTVALAELGQQSSKGVALWPVTSQTVMKRLGNGSWSDALRALGVEAVARGRARKGLRFTGDDYVEAMKQFLGDSEADSDASSRTYSSYVNWTSAQRDAGVERPSGSAVRAHFGSWSAAVACGEA